MIGPELDIDDKTSSVQHLGSPVIPDVETSVVSVIFRTAVLWSISSYCYYTLVDIFGLDSGYSDAPFVFAFYYLVWTGVAVWLFQSVLFGTSSYDAILRSTVLMVPLFCIFGFFVVVLLPLLPKVSVLNAPPNPPEFMFASAWYYLPKSADILFQQALVAALIFSTAKAQFRLASIALGMAATFGLLHLTLAFDGFTPIYVARFTVAGVLLGVVFPYFYLRLRHGFLWAYGLHASFYAIDVVITHLFLAEPSWAT